ncbi:hypothetical protein [Pyxidicoccus trucidator]|uniref:hypothetical protein n=1 Tax=Pyxidicoccus trucidator TaxID=2709662 RepID=UPI001F084B61|nr:hypothetical protein [Pyxidicoccus trucidator]
MAAIHLGTSGYVYKHWKGLLYPAGLPASRWLPRYAQVFMHTPVHVPPVMDRPPTGVEPGTA